MRRVTAVIYSHSHANHFGGVAGVVSEDEVKAGRVKVIAPEGFLEQAVSENVIAGPAMTRRARFQFGSTLARGPEGEMTSGLGPGISAGTVSLIAPTDTISKTGQKMTIDGVTLSFQVTPGTEAPAEMNFYLPQFRAVFMAENANAAMHNLLPARGALVRDAKAWADYLTESIRLYADKSDVMFARHGIPRWGSDVIRDFLTKHRDAYKFLHDQTVRLMNNGLTGIEIAEQLQLPDVLAHEWYNRGYYGTMSHNSKAIYQRYMGWYDAIALKDCFRCLDCTAGQTGSTHHFRGGSTMLASPQISVPPALTARRLIQVTSIAWCAYIGFDFLMNAGLFARFYSWQISGFLPPLKMFQYIPLGYAAFLLHTILVVWLMVRTNISGAQLGAEFGARIGILLGGAGMLGEMSIYAFPVKMLLLWAIFFVLAFTLVGAVIGCGLAARRMRPLVFRVILMVLGCLIVTIVLQSFGLAPAEKMPGGRIGVGWDPNR